jgi:galactokinase
LLEAGYARDQAVRALWAPGRVEVLGKHTDYAGGRSLLMAAERGLALLAADRDDAVLDAMTDGGGRATLEIAADLSPRRGDWTNYAMTVARRLARNFPAPPLRGLGVAAAGDLPQASGLSGSSAMIVGFYLALAARNGLEQRAEYARHIRSQEALAEYLSCVENGNSFGSLAGDTGVGTAGGSEDHTAILCCRAGLLSQYSFAPVRLEDQAALPEDLVFAIGASGVEAAKTGGAMASYNRASAVARAAVQAWNAATGRRDPHLGAAMASRRGAARALVAVLHRARHKEFSAAELAGRAQQFQAECELIPQAMRALRAGDHASLGELVDRSQALAQQWLGNQVPQTVALAREARRLGAIAASAFGAGFGGSVWALVKAPDAPAFLDAWRGAYANQFPDDAGRSEFFVTRPAGPAGEV